MSSLQFPDPVLLPKEIFLARKERKRQILRAAMGGIVIRLLIILFEFLGVYWFNSSALFMDAIASSFDIVTSLVLFLCIRLAARPPDEEHPFGHGRYEPLAGLQLGLLLVFIGVGMCVYQATQFMSLEKAGVMNPRAWLIPLIAAIFLEFSYQVMKKIANKRHSPALASDAIHYRIDALTSLFATAALSIGAVFPRCSLYIDHIGAMIIALLMVAMGVYAAKNNVDQLMDRVPGLDFFERVRKASLKVKGVLDTEKIRIQLYGPDAHVDIDIEVDPGLTVHLAHEISQSVRVEIQKDWPSVRDVTVHIEPYYPNDH